MPRMSYKEQLELWKHRVQVSDDIRDKMVPLWEDILNFYRSEPPTQYPAEDWKLQVNLVYAWFESMFPSLTFHHPHVTVEPKSETAVHSARTTESVLNNELQRINFHRQLNKTAFDALLFGVGVFTAGYYYDGLTPSVSESGEPPDETRRNNSDVPFGFTPGDLYVRRIRPDKFIVDPNATNLDDALYCGYEYKRPLELVKKDPQYQYTENLSADEYDLPPGMELEEYRKKYNRDPEMDQVCLYQIWDIVERKVYTFTKDGEKFLRRVDWPYQVERFPFWCVHATEDHYSFWNQSPVTPWLSLVNEYNLTVSNRLDHMSRNKAKIAYNSSMINDAEMENLMRSRNMALVGVDAPEGTDLRAAIQPIPTASLPPEHWAHLEEVRQRLTEVSGLSEFDIGGTRPGERPAAEIRRIGAGADIRRFGLAQRLTSSVADFARDFRVLIQQYYSSERTTEITDEFGDSEWVQYSGKNLAGEFSFAVSVEDLEPETREERRQKVGMLLQMLTPYSQVGSPIPRIDIDPLLRQMGKELGVGPFLRFLPSVLPPMDPSEEWYLIVGKKMDLEPNDQDDHDYHLFTHQIQLQENLTLQDPAAVERLKTHMERHEAKKLAMEMSAQGQQQTQQARQPQQPGGGQPGPQPGTPSNNPGGGAGTFAGSQGGPGGENLQEILRQGGAV